MAGVLGFWDRAAAGPDDTALILADGSRVAAGALARSANQLVHGMRARGMKPGDVLAVALKNEVAFLELYFAATQAGFYLVPMNARLTSAEMAHVLKTSGAQIFVCDERISGALEGARAADFPVERCFTTNPASDHPSFESLKRDQPTSAPPDRLLGAPMFYTSGTTGLPKAVKRPLPARSPDADSVASARFRVGGVGISARDSAVHLVVAPLYHSASLAWCTAHLHLGHKVVLMDEWTPEKMLHNIAEHRVTGTFMVPTHFHRLLALPELTRAAFDVTSLRHVVHGGAPCPAAIKQRMMAWWGPVIYEVYGAAEATIGTSVGPQEWLARPGTVGKAGARIRVLREDGTACAPREVGAIYFAADADGFEYLNDPTKTAEAKRGALFTVGDLGYVDEESYLFLSDRKADLIISGGVNIYPAEVESVLCEHDKVLDVAVFGIPDAEWGEQVKAIVELKANVPTDTATRTELLEHCRSRLASYKCPKTIDFTDSLPRDSTGKLQKRRLRDPYWESHGRKI